MKFYGCLRGECCLCGKALDYYETKYVHGEDGRMMCYAKPVSEETMRSGKALDWEANQAHPEADKAGFHVYTDG